MFLLKKYISYISNKNTAITLAPVVPDVFSFASTMVHFSNTINSNFIAKPLVPQ
jgi:hypothetical protein